MHKHPNIAQKTYSYKTRWESSAVRKCASVVLQGFFCGIFICNVKLLLDDPLAFPGNLGISDQFINKGEAGQLHTVGNPDLAKHSREMIFYCLLGQRQLFRYVLVGIHR